MIFKKIKAFALNSLLMALVGGSLSLAKDKTIIKVGVTAGPHAMIMDFVKKAASSENIEIQVIEFNDFILPNEALNEGDLQANCYQHQPFLDNQIKTRGYKITAIGKTVLMPLGVYSQKLTAIAELEEGARVAIPNDPTNGGRALLLLQKVGLLKIKDVPMPSILDIIENPKKLEIVELEAPQLPRSLDEVALAIINTDWVLLAGLDPAKAIAQEDLDSPYVNVIAVRQGEEDTAAIKDLIRFYHTQATKDFIKTTFKGAVLAGW